LANAFRRLQAIEDDQLASAYASAADLADRLAGNPNQDDYDTLMHLVVDQLTFRDAEVNRLLDIIYRAMRRHA
jgi:hypothetical protein